MAEDGRGVGRDPGRAKQLHAKADALDKPMPSGAPLGTDVSGAEDSCRRAHEAARCVDAAMAVLTAHV